MALQDFLGNTPEIRVVDFFVSNTMFLNEQTKQEKGWDDVWNSYTLAQVAHFARVDPRRVGKVVEGLVTNGVLEASPDAPAGYVGDKRGYTPSADEKTYRLCKGRITGHLTWAVMFNSGHVAAGR